MQRARSLLVALAAAIVVGVVAGCARDEPPTAAGPAEWAGSAACASCHATEYARWERSFHRFAMLSASPDAPLHAATHDDGPLVARDGVLSMTGARLGVPQDVRTEWVLGYDRLEQFVGPLVPGRLQALPLAWDIERREWFDLFASDPRTPDDWGHWTNRGMNANAQCLFCHTTNYVKGYQPATDTYDTRWSEIGVGCEACHGPGRHHVDARRAGRADAYGRLAPDAMEAVCGSCHSRRIERADWMPGARFLDVFEPELLDTPAHYPDGQVREELYELVAFGTSRMYQKGVRCWDCHDPHDRSTRKPGDEQCLTCHPVGYAAQAHTHHLPASTGARCTGCHMPVTVYMERDPRHDHSFQHPDPELTIALGVPNACNRCHGDHDAAWSVQYMRAWYPDDRVRAQRRAVATAIAQGRNRDPEAVPALLALLGDANADAVRRGSAARLLAAFPTTSGVTTALVQALDDRDGLVRASAAWTLGQRPAPAPEVRAGLERRLDDPIRIVRQHAALGLRQLDPATLPPAVASALRAATAEWQHGQTLGADTPEAHYNLAIYLAARGDVEAAVAEYREALRLWPGSIQARHNLAMLLAQQQRLPEAEAEFRALLARDPVPQSAFALGLLYGQMGRWRDAASALEQCVREAPDYPRARYNLALALAKAGETTRALDELERAAADPDARRDAILTLVDLARQVNDRPRLERWLLEAARLDPRLADDPSTLELLER